MKKFFLLLLFIPLLSFGQNLNGYKYIYVKNISYDLKDIKGSTSDYYGLSEYASTYFRTVGLISLNENQFEDFKSRNINSCEALTAKIEHYDLTFYTQSVTIEIYDCNSKLVYSKTANAGSDYYTKQKSLGLALGKVLYPIKKSRYNFKPELTPEYVEYLIKNKNSTYDIRSETSIRKFFDQNGYEGIEGIWNVNRITDAGIIYTYKLMIIRDDINYNGIIIEAENGWFPGDTKAVFEETAVNEILTVNWTMADKRNSQKIFANIVKENMIQFALSGDVRLYKVYPKIGNNKNNRNSTTLNIRNGSGSGIIISKSGYIITNYHVINTANDIQVEFNLNDKIQTFNAEIVEFDKQNDLAVLKILDINFDGLEEINYNFKSRISDVGTKVYTFGYPRIGVQGEEIKITDGIISSKTGYEGERNKYQVTAPMQPGNSGGPLFDDKGNFIGINSSQLNEDAETTKNAQNVNYSIKTSYVLNLIDILPKSIELPSYTKLESLPLTEQIKEISKYVVLIKVK